MKLAETFKREVDEGGTFYRAVVAGAEKNGQEIGFFNADIESLQYHWDLVMDLELNVSKIQHVKIYEDKK